MMWTGWFIAQMLLHSGYFVWATWYWYRCSLFTSPVQKQRHWRWMMSHLAIWHFRFRSFRGSASRTVLAVQAAGTRQFYFAPDLSWVTFQYSTLCIGLMALKEMQWKNIPLLACLITAGPIITTSKGIHLWRYWVQTFFVSSKAAFWMDLLGCLQLFACQHIWHSI